MANKAYKFRLYPTKKQEQLLAKTFGCVRFAYNKMQMLNSICKRHTRASFLVVLNFQSSKAV
ncbi:helix-turn-helix domain-containing protein, partial [Aneurinibacillus terranovensis]|uniref:helix-turn-helix domain-containing protein n=1 Tax=Aneurinibacillus terranovensis TaxID=278991 RepID=UPI003CCC2AF1